jgi:hypothetical protein
VSHSRIPDLALHEGFVRQAEICDILAHQEDPYLPQTGRAIAWVESLVA